MKGSREEEYLRAPGGPGSPPERPTSNRARDGLVDLALVLALGMLAGAPHLRWTEFPIATLALGLVLVLGRSLWLSWAAILVASGSLRLLPLWGYWSDQDFVQLASLSSLLSGHGIYYQWGELGTCWSIYAPTGSLLATFPVWFLGAGWPRFYQLFVLLVASTPFLIAPSRRTFRLFVVLALFFPLMGTTATGNALELSVVTLLVGYWLLLRGRALGASGALLGFGALLRQPLLLQIPFLALAFYRARARRGLLSFAAVVGLGGALHVLRNPTGFLHATVGLWPDFADQWFAKLGAPGNYSISTPLSLLVGPAAFDRAQGRWYFALLALVLGVLAVAAWRARTTEGRLACALGASLAGYVTLRGFVQFHYLVAAALPALAFPAAETPEDDPQPAERPGAARGRAALAVALEGVVALLVATPWVLALVGQAGDRPPVGEELAVRSVEARSADGAARTIDLSLPEAPAHLRDGERLVVELADAAEPTELDLVGARIPRRWVDGVVLTYPVESEVTEFLVSGAVEASQDGASWWRVATFDAPLHPSVYPRRIRLEAQGRRARYLRVVPFETWRDAPAWALGGVRVFGRSGAPATRP